MTVSRLLIVYNADGGLLGELSYVAKKLVGAGSCSLCDITHTLRGQKPAWKDACGRLPVEVEALHRNELEAGVERFIAGRYPCVVGIAADGPKMLVEPAELDALGGDVAAFERVLAERLA